MDMANRISRRSVLRAAAAGALAVPFSIITSHTCRADIVGAGAHQYELVPNWGSLPPSKRFGYTHGVATDSQGRIFIHNQSEDAVAIFDSDGKFISSWGKEFAAGAHGMQLGRDAEGEFLILADIDRKRVIKTTLDGKEIWNIGCPAESGVYPDPKAFVPTNVAIAPSGEIYVADGYGSSYIHRYTPAGQYLSTFAGPGSELGKVACPHGIWIDTRGAQPIVLVADRGNARLQTFTLEGQPIALFTEELRAPCHFDQRGTDLLIPDLHGRVTIFDKHNKLIAHLGDTPGVEKTEGYPNLPHEKRIPGQFISPHGAIWDHTGNIYVVEWINDGRITKLRHIS